MRFRQRPPECAAHPVLTAEEAAALLGPTLPPGREVAAVWEDEDGWHVEIRVVEEPFPFDYTIEGRPGDYLQEYTEYGQTRLRTVPAGEFAAAWEPIPDDARTTDPARSDDRGES